MTRALSLLLLLAVTAAAPQQNSIDRDKLERLRSMSPEQRALLKARLEEIKKLPAAEVARLRDNLLKIKAMPVEEVKKLREKGRALTREDREEYSKLASGFFAWAKRRQVADSFPRGLFFTWLKSDKPEAVREIRSMDAGVGGPRVDAFIKLYTEFRNTAIVRLESHAQKHLCVSVEDVSLLRDAPPEELWPKFHELTRACQAKNGRKP
jgi:hypothetical protein